MTSYFVSLRDNFADKSFIRINMATPSKKVSVEEIHVYNDSSYFDENLNCS